MAVTHNTTTAEPNDPDYDVSADAWNEAHAVADGSFAAAKLTVSATDRLIGRDTAGSGNGEEIAPSAVRAMLDLEVGTDVQAFMASASQGEMEAGTEAALRAMSPLRVAQAIAALASGSFDPDDHLPWHVVIIPMVWTPDATTGTWVNTGFTSPTTGADSGFYIPGSTANSGSAVAFFNSAGAQNDAVAWDVILAAGTWDAHFWVRESTNTGIITLRQDGASQGTVDTYAAAAAHAKVSITGWTVSATGKHRMQVLMATKNASSSGYFGEIFAIEFRRTA